MLRVVLRQPIEDAIEVVNHLIISGHTIAVRIVVPSQPQRLHAGLPRAVHVGVQAIPNMHGAHGSHANGVEGVRENFAVRLLPTDHGGDADVLHAGHQPQAMQQV